MYAQVIVDIAHTEVDRLFTYLVPEGLQVEKGHHVLVPFGRGNKQIEGFVIEVSDAVNEQHRSIKSITRLLLPYPIFTEQQLELARWIQKSYHSTLVDALRLMIPAQLRGGRVQEKTERIVRLADGVDGAEARVSLLNKNGQAKAPKQVAVLDLLKDRQGGMPVRDILAYCPGASGAITALLKKGILAEDACVTFRTPSTVYRKPEPADVALIPAQAAAIDAIIAGMERGEGVYLLHGVTGSGKTEVYMRCIQHCLVQNKQAILLVPEIALTPQAMGLFRARFGDDVAVLHSRLSAGERFDEWRRIRLNRARVAVGARSAVFAPFERIGLIVVDEEHEGSYQSETTPRYHAVEVAKKRCQLSRSALVLGSATPSLQSYMRARAGGYQLLELPERVNGLPMPAMHVVDMREEFLKGNNSIFSMELQQRLADCISAGNQAILFMNRRGYSTFVSCRGCGHVFVCPNCDVSLTYHKTEETVKCHYCGYRQELPASCPNCERPYIKYFGVGTQQVKEQLHKLFPDVAALRMDRDSTHAKDAHAKILQAFQTGEAQVLIGTQMVAKGLDFPDVTLVGIVAADSTLYLPDYRSAERTFQLLMQVSGRAGRAQTPGSVVVQTYSPGHYSIRFARDQDYKGFFGYEIAQRRAALFPPFSLFVRALYQGLEEEALQEDSLRFQKGVEEALRSALKGREEQILFCSASPAPIYKRQGVYRHQVVIKLLRTNETGIALKTIYQYVDAHRSERFALLEVNPSDLL